MSIISPTLEADLDRLRKLILKFVRVKRGFRLAVTYEPDRGRVVWTVSQKNITEDDVS